jgi:two-component system, cell cycle sensor histidine kinase and response regulator CckA
VRVLHLEDKPEDGELVSSILAEAGLECETHRVETKAEFLAALESGSYDLVLSDFSLPSYDGLGALDALRERQPDTPFIFISGTIGEERAIESLKKGATDYVLKDNLSRLPSAILRALEEAAERRTRREAQETIREQAALLELAREAILVEDLNGRVTYWNPAAERLYGVGAEEARERGVRELLYGGNPRAIQEARSTVFAAGEWSGLLTQKTAGGAEILVQSHWTLIRDIASKPKSLLVINTDVTEARRMEAKFLRAQRMESIGALAGGIAHDLNNVLSPILMAIEILRRKLTDAQGQRVLGTLETSARRGADLVKQVLTFARGSEGERTLLQVGHLVREMEKIARETFPRTVQVRVDVPATLWIISGEPTPLHQVLMNLCVNARDAMPQGGTLTLSAANATVDAALAQQNPGSKAGPYVMLTVADTGSGIDGAILERIFDPFFTTKAGSGTGLGLSTSLSIVKSHGGFMDVESRPGQGTVFKVYLPALPGRQDLGGEAPFAPLPVGHGELVLVVDDETSVREIAREILETQGYRCLTAADGREALAVYEEHRGEVQVVVTDLAMPKMDGAAVVRAIRGLDPRVKIIAASGLGSDPSLADLSAKDVQAFLAKPYTSEKLLETVAKVLAG